MERLEARGVCGHIEHPSDGLPDLRKFAVVLTDVGFYEDMVSRYPETDSLNIENPETAVVGLFEALSTPDGRIVEALWMDEVQTGASSRAQGSVVTNETQYPQFPVGIDIVQNDVDEETLVWDIVARPSTPGAFPARVLEAINEAIEEYKREALNEAKHLSPPIGEGLGGQGMNISLVEVRTRLSRIKPFMENMKAVRGEDLLKHLSEVNTLLESVGVASKNLTESQQMPAADMSGELQSLRDRIMAHIGAAFTEAEAGRIPGATPMKVADKTTSNFAALNSDPALDYPSSQSYLPGGRAGAGAIQEPDAGTSDQSVPGAGVKPSGDSKLAPDQSEEERRKQAHGKIDGDAGPGGGAGVSGASIGKKGGASESITTDQAHKTHKGEIGQEIVTQSEEGDGMEVDDYGRNISAQPLKAGKTGSKDGSKTQGIVASQEPGPGQTITDDGGEDMSGEALANLNLDLVKECRALRQETAHWRGKYERANSLVVETGSKFREQRFKMSLERMIENNPALDNTQARSVLETARDEAHMVQIAEAILGTRARMSKTKESDLKLKMESDGFFRLIVNGKLHEKILDGDTMYEALLKMGISEDDVDMAFDDAYTDSGLYKMPDGVEGEPYVMVPMEPADEEGGEMDDMGGEGGVELDLDFGGDDEGDEEGDEEDFVADEEEVTEMSHSDMGGKHSDMGGSHTYMGGKHGKGRMAGKKGEKDHAYMGGKDHSYMGGKDHDDKDDDASDMDESKKSRFQKYAESRGLKKSRKSLTEGKTRRKPRRKPRQPVAGSKRLSENLPPAGGAPATKPPAVSQGTAPAAPQSLTEKIIAREKAAKLQVEEARKAQAHRMQLNG